MRIAKRVIVAKATGEPLDSFTLIEPGDFGRDAIVDVTIKTQCDEDDDDRRES